MPANPYALLNGPDNQIKTTLSWQFQYEDGDPRSTFVCPVRIASLNSSSSGNTLMLREIRGAPVVTSAGEGVPAPTLMNVAFGVLQEDPFLLTPELIVLWNLPAADYPGGFDGEETTFDDVLPMPYSAYFSLPIGPNGPPIFGLRFELNEPLTPPLDITFSLVVTGHFIPNELLHPCGALYAPITTVISTPPTEP